MKLLPLWPIRKRLIASLEAVTTEELYGKTTSEIISDIDEPCHQALLACFMLAFSMPYEKVAEMPAEISVSYMRGGRLPNWYFLRAGVYSYIEKMISEMPKSHRRLCDAPVETVMRDSGGIRLKARGLEEEKFDKVVFATTPGRVLNILSDPTDAETERFESWSCNAFTTIAHRDTSIYRRFDTEIYGPCDYFRFSDNRRFGYNTYLNHGYGEALETPYSFAYNLAEEIPLSAVLHRAEHQTPNYTVAALKSRREIQETNGNNDTFHVGAYLGNALHEGAASSANAVSRLLGGEVL